MLQTSGREYSVLYRYKSNGDSGPGYPLLEFPICLWRKLVSKLRPGSAVEPAAQTSCQLTNLPVPMIGREWFRLVIADEGLSQQSVVRVTFQYFRPDLGCLPIGAGKYHVTQ